MSDQYRIFGSMMSPYSLKVRSYFRYKGIPHEWIVRSQESMEEYQKYARLPIVPAVATPEDEGLQDSTPIIEAMEAKFADPSIHPDDPGLRFLSSLIEEFGDEWGNKWMFHYRWAREADQISAADRVVADMMPGATEDQRAPMADQIRERLVGRIGVVGSNEVTAPFIEKNFQHSIDLLEAHLSGRAYLFGARPSFGDFGLSAQIYEAWTDPTAGTILNERAPHTCQWHQRMLAPEAKGEFENWNSLSPTLKPLLSGPVRIFLTWSDANARAIASGAEELKIDLDGSTWSQTVGGPQKYHAKSLKELRRKYSEVHGQKGLSEILQSTGCLEWLHE